MISGKGSPMSNWIVRNDYGIVIPILLLLIEQFKTGSKK